MCDPISLYLIFMLVRLSYIKMDIFCEFASVGPDLGTVFLLMVIAIILPLVVGGYYREWDSLPVMG
jgi:hypothetical protein